MRFNLSWVVALLCVVSSIASLEAGSPRLVRITPPGGQRGTVATIELLGRYLEQPKDLLFYESGVTVESIEKVDSIPTANGRSTPVEAGTRLKLKLKIAADCSLGAHGFRLRTAEGLTEYVRFFVGPFPSVDEDEQLPLGRNDTRETAKSVPLNHTVFGRLNDPTDLDTYKIQVKKGQRITAEIESARLGIERGVPDLHLAIYDATGKKLAAADDSALFLQDPILSILAPQDGIYFVEVRHSNYGGAGDQYRLHLGTFSRPTAFYPSGGQAGEDVSVQVLGDPRGAWNKVVALPRQTGDWNYSIVDQDGLSAPTPNKLRVSPFPNVLEVEPNEAPSVSGSAPSLPLAFNGIINKPGDVDTFTFQAKKGQQFRFQVYANAIGSPVDPLIWIKPANGKGAPQRSADSRANQLGFAPANGQQRETHDPVLDFTAPADGEYVLGVEDERSEGGPDYVYRVEAMPDSNAIYTYIAPETENQNAPQLRQAIVLAPGNRWTSQIAIFSTNRPFNGDLELVGLNLPKGVSMQAPKLTPGMTRVPVVFEATADAVPQAALIDLVVRPANSKDLNFSSGYRQTIMMNAYGNNDYYLHTPVEKLALCVTEPAPFKVEVDAPKTSLVQNGEMLLKFKVQRQKGYEGSVTVMMDWKPAGVSTATPVTVASDQTEGTYLLGAARNATAGKYNVTLTAMSGSGRAGYNDPSNRTYAASNLFTINVAEPHVEARIARTSIERGKTATLVCKLNHLQPFQGNATATLARLPRGVELVDTTRQITSADKEVSFTIRATSEALVGNYQGITLDLTVTENGQAVRQLTGYGLLRIDAERGTKPNK
jgi:hypothetical protein